MVCRGAAKKLTPLIISHLDYVKTINIAPVIICEVAPCELMPHMRFVAQNDPTESRGFEELLGDVDDIMKLYCNPTPPPPRAISDPIIDAETKNHLSLFCVPKFARTTSINQVKAITKPRKEEIPEITELRKTWNKNRKELIEKIATMKEGRMPIIPFEMLEPLEIPERPSELTAPHAEENKGLHDKLVVAISEQVPSDQIDNVWKILEKAAVQRKRRLGRFFGFGGQSKRDTKKRYRAQNKRRTSKSKPKTKKYNTKKRLTRRRYTTKK